MSVEAMTAVLHHAKADGAAFAVLIGIANHQGDGGAWPSIETLAKYARRSERTTTRLVGELEAAGELVVDARPGRSNRYFVTVQCPPECDRSLQHRLIHTPVTGDTPQTPVTGDTPVTHDTPTPVTGDTTPLSRVTPEPKENPTLNQGRGSSTASTTDRTREVVDLEAVRRQIRGARSTS